MKIFSVGDQFFYADGKTDTAKLLFAYRNFAKLQNIYIQYNFSSFVLIDVVLSMLN